MEEMWLIFAPFDPCSLDRIDTVINSSRDEVAARPEGGARSFLERKHLNRFGLAQRGRYCVHNGTPEGEEPLYVDQSGRGLVEGFCPTTFLFIKQKAVTNNVTL